MPSFDFIRSYLSDVRQRVRRQFATCATLALVAVWMLLALALPLLATAIAPGRATALALLGGGGLIAVLALAAAIIAGIVFPLRRYASDAAVARWIGGRARPIASDLLSTVELHGATGPGAPSPVLVRALTDSTARRLVELDRRTLVDAKPTRQAWAALGAVSTLALVLLVFASDATIGGWRRLAVPPARPWNGATLSTVPLVGDVTITLTPPAYSRRAPTVLTSTSGDFRALAGSTARIVTTALEPALAVSIVVERGTPDAPAEPETIALTPSPDGLAVELPITGPARYRFELDTPRKQRKIETVAHAIEVEPDAAPTIELYAPAEELDVTNMKRIELAYVAEDDFGLGAIELVWDIAGKEDKKPVAAFAEQPGRAQGKLVWDLAEMTLPPGAQVTYHLEVVDNDTVGGPNRGTSRPFRLRVFSPRERHQQNLAKQAELAEHVVAQLGFRLTAADGEVGRDDLHRGLDELAVEAGTLAAAYADDPLADPALRSTITGLRDRLAKLTGAEERLLEPAGRRPARPAAGRFANLDKQIVTELEDDAILLADWLQREQMEGMLDIADELEAHQQRLAELLAEYARTGDEKLKAEIARELHAIDQRMAELASFRAGIAEDVLDQFVHADAMPDRESADCMDEVERLAMAGDAAGAQAALERCRSRTADATRSLEDALHELRGDRFTESEKKLDELMNELADLAQDQTDIAAEADRIFERYADRADELMHDLGKDARHRLGSTVDRLQDRLDAIPDSGLTPFAREELEIVDKRIADLERMLDDGDVAEALGMAKQARQSLETVASELDAAMADDPASPWAQATSDAIDGVERAHPLADKLVDELETMTPSPEQILGDDDKRRLDALRRRQAMTRDRARQLADKAKNADGVPGEAAKAIGQRVGEAAGPMGQAEKRMGGRDPSGARDAARSAADALQKARQEAQKAARQAQSQGNAALGDEPVRIPGADEYVAPEAFRQELLEAMKKRPPSGYDDQVRRYYEELIR